VYLFFLLPCLPSVQSLFFLPCLNGCKFLFVRERAELVRYFGPRAAITSAVNARTKTLPSRKYTCHRPQASRQNSPTLLSTLDTAFIKYMLPEPYFPLYSSTTIKIVVIFYNPPACLLPPPFCSYIATLPPTAADPTPNSLFPSLSSSNPHPSTRPNCHPPFPGSLVSVTVSDCTVHKVPPCPTPWTAGP